MSGSKSLRSLAALLGIGVLAGCRGPSDNPPIPVSGAGMTAAPGGGAPPSGLGPADEVVSEDIIRNGDTLTMRIMVTDTVKYNEQDRVDEFGNITVPHLETVKAAGLTSAQLETHIREQLVAGEFYVDPQVIVILGRDRYFWVSGEVTNRIGQIPYSVGLTLTRAIAMAGGFNEWANRREVSLTRGNEVFTIDAEAAIKDPNRDVEIRPGDRIYVKRRLFS